MPKDQELNLHRALPTAFYYFGRCQTSSLRIAVHFLAVHVRKTLRESTRTGSRVCRLCWRSWVMHYRGTMWILVCSISIMTRRCRRVSRFHCKCCYQWNWLKSWRTQRYVDSPSHVWLLFAIAAVPFWIYPRILFFLLYSQVTKAYYQFLNCIFRYHLDTIVMVDSNTFLKLIDAFREGLEVALDTSIINVCAQSVDHLATFMFNHINLF